MTLITCTIVIAAIRCRGLSTISRLKFIKAEPGCARYVAELSLVFERGRQGVACHDQLTGMSLKLGSRSELVYTNGFQEETVRHWLGDRPTNFLKARLNAASDS